MRNIFTNHNRFYTVLALLLAMNFQASGQELANLINSSGNDVIRLDNGLAIAVHQKGKGPKAQDGDYVKVQYEGKLLNGQSFDKSEADRPLVFQLGHRQVIAGWEAGFTALNKGSKATLYIPSALGYGNRGAGTVIPPNADLIFDIQLLEIMDQAAYDNYMDAEEEKAKTAFKLEKKRQFQKEIQLIRSYARKEKLKIKALDSGMSILIKKKGKKGLATEGNTLAVSYTGYLMDGTVFDKTEPGQPFSFEMGANKVIPGWEEGLKYFGQGGQGKLIIPSKLAYGPRPITEGEITIPGNSVLIFDIKVVEIKP